MSDTAAVTLGDVVCTREVALERGAHLASTLKAAGGGQGDAVAVLAQRYRKNVIS